MARVNLFTQADDFTGLSGVKQFPIRHGEAVPDGEGGEFVGGFGEAGFHVDDEQEGALFALEGGFLLGENFLHLGVARW